MNCTRTKGLAIAFAVLILTGTSFAAIIQDVAGTLLSTDWYHGDGDYFQTNLAGSSWPAYIEDLYFSTQEGAYYWIDNSLDGGTFTLGPSSLVADQTPPNGLAKGIIASGATLTINGNLYADDWSTVVASGDLVIAEVTAQWELKELPPPARADTVVGRAFFHITGGALSNASFNDDGLVLGNFYIDFTFQGCSPTVTDFSTLLGNNAYNCPHLSIQGAGVPEPASIAILALGGLALIRKRR